MQARVNLMFKGISQQEAGTFKNNEGIDTPYDAKYVVNVDDISTEGEAKEFKLKFDIHNSALANKLKGLASYQMLPFLLNLKINTNGTFRFELLDVDITKAKLKE